MTGEVNKRMSGIVSKGVSESEYVAMKPVDIPPTIPPIAWTPKASKASSNPKNK